MPVQHRAGELRDLYKAQDYAGMVKWIRDSMGLDLRVKLGLLHFPILRVLKTAAQAQMILIPSVRATVTIGRSKVSSAQLILCEVAM